MPEKKKLTNNIATLSKFHEIEVQKLFDAMLTMQNLRLQLGTLFGTANVVVLGVAFTSQKVGVLLFAASILWAVVLMDFLVMGFVIRLYYRGLLLQNQFAQGEYDTFLSLVLSGRLEKRIREIVNLPEREQRFKAIRILPIRSPTIAGFWIPFIAGLVEIVAALVLRFVFGWSVF